MPFANAHHRRGFTLLELVISIALVLVLMLAITKIFSITSTTIGASQGISAAMRDARAAQTVFARDVSAMASDSPFIWIRYDGYKPAFRNSADLQADHDIDLSNLQADGDSKTAENPHKLSIDLDDSGVEGDAAGENFGTLAISNRNHRLDRFSFCARDRFSRQTGNSFVLGNASFPTDQLVSGMTSSEAWITYGHVALPKPDGSYNVISGGAKTYPGFGTPTNNPANYFASQWTLGRTAMVMVMPNVPVTGAAATETLTDASGNPQQYYGRTQTLNWLPDPLTALTNRRNDRNLSPMNSTTPSHPVTGLASTTVLSARYDLVGIDMAHAKERINLLIEAQSPVAAKNPNADPLANNWWTELPTSRLEVNPFVFKPINAATSSHQVPMFLPACSQFVVEYAGDFVSQLPDGSLDTTKPNGGLSPDGQIDFHFVNATRERKIQWFGYPRSTTGGSVADATTGDDVLLVGDFVGYITDTGALTPASKKMYKTYAALNAANMNPDFASWEKFGTATKLSPSGTIANRANILFTDARAPFAQGALETVYAVWGPDSIDNPNIPRPKMYRFTFAIDRPEMAGRSADPQTFEYIYTAP